MDPQTALGAVVAILTIGGVVVGIALHAGKSRSLAEDALHKARNVEQAHGAYIAHVSATYARKETTDLKFTHISEALERIETAVNSRSMGV